MRAFGRCVLLVSLALTAAAEARGGPDAGAPASAASARARDRALDLTDLGERAYREGRLDEAADLLRRAYELYPSTVLLYNMARVEESAGHDARAADLYEEYLRAEPNAKNRAALVQRVEMLRQRERERAETQRQRDQALARAHHAEQAAQQQPQQPPLAAAPPWIALGIGASGVAAGVVFGAVAASEESAADDDPTHAGAVEHFERAEDFATASNVALVAGGVICAAAIVWLVVRAVGSDSARAAVPTKLTW